MLYNKRLSIPLCLLAVLIAISFTSPLFISKANKSQSTGVVRISKAFDPAPIAIARILVEGKEVKDGENFLAGGGWVKTLQLEIRNTTPTRNFVQVGFTTDFEPFIPKMGIYGGSESRESELILRPNQTTTIAFHPSAIDLFEAESAQTGSYPASVTLTPEFAVDLGGETAWLKGDECFKYQVSKEKSLWIPESADWSDPELQKMLDPNYRKPKAKLEKTRFDDTSGLSVLDADDGDCYRAYPGGFQQCPAECPTCYFHEDTGPLGGCIVGQACKLVKSETVRCRTAATLGAPFCPVGCNASANNTKKNCVYQGGQWVPQ